MGPHDTHLLFKDLWKATSRIRHKIFFWLLLHDRVSSRSLLKRKNFLLQSYECAICQDHVEETSLHLLWDCHFALSCWDSIAPHRCRGVSAFDNIISLKQCFPAPIAMDIVIMGCWNIWMQRNGKIFKAVPPGIHAWKQGLYQDLSLVKHRTKEKNIAALEQWMYSLLS